MKKYNGHTEILFWMSWERVATPNNSKHWMAAAFYFSHHGHFAMYWNKGMSLIPPSVLKTLGDIGFQIQRQSCNHLNMKF
jgi:hypothetical protein